MPREAPPNGGALPNEVPMGPRRRVSEMQAKLHRWAAADPDRRFDDLFNFVHDPATLIVAFDRVAGNTGSRTAGVDGLTVADVEEQIGVSGFLDDLRAQLKAGTFRPLPVRERKIPKPGGSGKVRSLGIPTVADRVVQAALKLVLDLSSRPTSCRSPTGSGRCGEHMTRSLRYTGSAPWVIGGCWTRTSRRALTPSTTSP
jgi:RNA-directed DNA polymerase